MSELEFEQLVAPLSLADFAATLWGRQVRHFSGDRTRFDSLFGWRDLDNALNQQRLEWPRLRVFRDGLPVAQDDYSEEIRRRGGTPYRRLRAGKLNTVLASGATLVLDHLDHINPAVCNLAMAIERTLGSSTWVNLYASWGTTRGFDLHWDDHDVFALQLSGSKRWQLHHPTRQWPLQTDVEDNIPPGAESVPMLVDLSPGDVLYVPHGWWHFASPLEEPSLHLTFGVSVESGIDYLTWLVDQLRADELLRRRLPRFSSADGRDSHLSEIRTRLLKVLDDSSSMEDFLRYVGSVDLERLRFDLARVLAPEHALADDSLVRLLVPRSAVYVEDGCLVFAALEKRWTLNVSAEPLIRALVDESPITVAHLCAAAPDIDSAEVLRLLSDLSREGVLAVE